MLVTPLCVTPLDAGRAATPCAIGGSQAQIIYAKIGLSALNDHHRTADLIIAGIGIVPWRFMLSVLARDFSKHPTCTSAEP